MINKVEIKKNSQDVCLACMSQTIDISNKITLSQKGYRLHYLLTGVTFVARDRRFYESIYPYHVFSLPW